MKRFLCVVAAVVMTMLFNPVQAETEIVTADDWVDWCDYYFDEDDATLNPDDGDILQLGLRGSEESHRVACAKLFGKVSLTGSGGMKTISGMGEDSRPTYQAIYTNEDLELTLANVTFANCGGYGEKDGEIPYKTDGGAIYSYNSDLTLKGTSDSVVKFQDNCTTGDVSSYYGGAIYASRLNLSNFGNLSFDGNKSFWEGGAIYIDDGDIKFINNGNVTFSNNTMKTENDQNIPNDIYVAYQGNVVIQGGNYSFGSGIYVQNGNIEISSYKEGETTKNTTVTFDCDLTANTVSITDSEVTFGPAAPSKSPAMAPTVASTPGLVGKEVFLKSEDMVLQSEQVSTNDAIKNTAVMLNADPDKTYTVGGNLSATENSTLNIQDDLNVTGNFTMSDSTVSMALLTLLTVGGDASLTGTTFNLSGTAKEGDVFTLLTATGSITQSSLLASIAGYTGDYEFKVNGNALELHLGAEPTETAVPEPSTWALLILGSAGLWFIRRRNAKK